MLKKIITSLLLATSLYTAQAQVVLTSLEEAWKYADEHNITIRTSGYELDKYTFARKQSYMAFLPTVSTSASFTENISLQTTLIPAILFGGPADVYRPVQFGQKYIYSGGITAQMDILNLQTWLTAKLAKTGEDMNRAALANTKKMIYQQVATQYYACIISAEAARLSAGSAAIADSVYRSVQNKFNEGTVSLANLDMAKLNSERASQQEVNAQYQMIISRNALKSLLNLSLSDSLTLRSALKNDLPITFKGTFSEDPAIRLAKLQTEVNLGTLRASNAAYIPVITATYSNTTQQNDNKFEPFKSGGPSWYPAQYWGIKASWTIFNGGMRWLKSENNKLTYYQSKAQYEAAQKQSAINDDNLRLAYDRAATLLVKSESIMNLSLDNYHHASERYAAGISSLDDRLNAFNDYITYQNQYLNSLSELMVQLYQIKIRQQSF